MRKGLILVLLPLTAFGLTMDEAVNIALQNNLRIKQKEMDIHISKLQLKEDKNLWYPQFFINYSFTFLKDTPYTNLPPSALFPVPFSFKQMSRDFYNFEIGFNYPIFTGFSRTGKIKISKAEINFNQKIYDEERINTVAEVKKAYIDVLMAEAVLDIYRKQYSAVKSHLERAEEFYKEGLIAKVEVLQSKVRLSQIEMKIKKAEGDLNVAKSRLNVLLDQKMDKDFDVEPVYIEIPDSLDLNGLIRSALENRNVIKAMRIKESELDYLEKIEKSDFYPKVFAQGKYFYSDQYPYLDPKGNLSFTVALNLQFQGIKPYYASLKVKEEKRKLKLKIRDLQNSIKLQVKAAYENFSVALKNLKVAQSSLKEAKEYYRMVKEQYINQLASTTDVLDAESYLTSARKGVTISRYQLLKAYIDLEKAVGGKIEE
ncbi:MAG TPA: TolC family protein [Persephonella sp.]|uniref:Outer membrane efflux protein n=1 Tax=Persephonella marina (strain DSM 14350 / EX-H1) TaxID=123214 RepID=C0QPJ4_PERMH|nr:MULTISPECIES: TolC family protein [Persephonella]ACO03873.1 outer membrane efflux protein [Persephonella marina EX-H1]HCB69795.1 TolC family protein [Persephonella sp.]